MKFMTLCPNTMEAEIGYCQKVNTLISVLHWGPKQIQNQ